MLGTDTMRERRARRAAAAWELATDPSRMFDGDARGWSAASVWYALSDGEREAWGCVADELAPENAVVVDRARFARLLAIADEIAARHDEQFGLSQPGVDRLYGTLELGDRDPLP